MDTLKKVVSSHQPRLQRLGNLQRLVSWRALPFLLVTALLLLALIPHGLVTTPVLAAHQGEETAKYLPSDTDLYLTVNLDPSSDQLLKFWTFVNNWWQDPNVQAKWGEGLGQIVNDTHINIEEDVLPWLGPEIAVGMCNLTSGSNIGVGTGYVAAANTEVANVESAQVAYMIEHDGNTTMHASDLYPTYISALPKYYDYTFDENGVVVIPNGTASVTGNLKWDSYTHRWKQISTEAPTEAPEYIVFVGTMDKDASYSFVRNKVMRLMIADQKGIEPEEVTDAMLPPSSLAEFNATSPQDIPAKGGWGRYNGTPIIIIPTDGVYIAFTDNYIIICQSSNTDSSNLFYQTLDRMQNSSPDSLWGTTNFQNARSALPADRVGMFYFDSGHIWEQSVAQIPSEAQLLSIEAFGNYIPSCFAASLSFGSNGIVTTAYYPLPAGMTLPTTKPDLLRSTKIVPGDALFFTSGQDVNAIWQQIRGLIADNWGNITAGIQPSDLPKGMTIGNIATLNALIGWIATNYGVNIDNDVFSWMTGEYAYAMLSPTSIENGPVDQLMMFEVGNTSDVEGHLATIIDGINAIIKQSTPAWKTADTLRTSTTFIDGVSATQITNNAIDDSAVLSPGYLFLNVDNTHYLVIGTTTEALKAAVKASKGEIPSLDEAEACKGLLSMLPETKLSLGYFDVSGLLNFDLLHQQQSELEQVQNAVTQMMKYNGLTTINGVQTPTNNMSAFPDTTTTHGTLGVGWSIYHCDVDGDGVYDPWYPPYNDTSFFWPRTTTWNYTCDNHGTVTQHSNEEIDMISGLFPLQCALGYSGSLQDTKAAIMTGALYLLPPPLVSQAIPAGTSTVEIPEQVFDFSNIDTKVGRCAVSVEVNINNAPAGANIAITALKELSENITSGFELAATGAGVSIVDIAYGIRVDKTGGLTADNIGTANITMKVNATWANEYGVKNVRIFRVGDDGLNEVLPTTFTGYTDDNTQAIFVGTSEHGLSYFALIAVAEGAGTNWALIGGIIGGVILVVAAIVTVILLRRRRAVA